MPCGGWGEQTTYSERGGLPSTLRGSASVEGISIAVSAGQSIRSPHCHQQSGRANGGIPEGRVEGGHGASYLEHRVQP